MGKYIDITGQKFGLLTALNVDHKTKWDEHWLCKCDCGNKVTRSKSGLRKGLSTSCGCERYKKPESVKFILFCNQLSKQNWLSIALIAVFFQFPH